MERQCLSSVAEDALVKYNNVIATDDPLGRRLTRILNCGEDHEKPPQLMLNRIELPRPFKSF